MCNCLTPETRQIFVEFIFDMKLLKPAVISKDTKRINGGHGVTDHGVTDHGVTDHGVTDHQKVFRQDAK